METRLRHVSTHDEQVFSKILYAHGGYCHCGEVQANAAGTYFRPGPPVVS